MTISSAGSARKPTIISRRAPSVPKAVPISIAASDRKTRAVASSPTSAMASAAIVKRQARAHRGNDAGGDHHRAKDDVGRDAKEAGGALGDHRVLVKELANAAVGKPDARGASVLQPRAALVDPTEKERCGREGRDELECLGENLDRLHNMSARSTMSVTKLYSR